jgi:hypothetical protein
VSSRRRRGGGGAAGVAFAGGGLPLRRRRSAEFCCRSAISTASAALRSCRGRFPLAGVRGTADLVSEDLVEEDVAIRCDDDGGLRGRSSVAGARRLPVR